MLPGGVLDSETMGLRKLANCRQMPRHELRPEFDWRAGVANGGDSAPNPFSSFENDRLPTQGTQ